MSSARRGVDQATRDDQANSAAASRSSSVRVDAHPSASDADVDGDDQRSSASTEPDSPERDGRGSVSVPGDPLAPPTARSSGTPSNGDTTTGTAADTSAAGDAQIDEPDERATHDGAAGDEASSTEPADTATTDDTARTGEHAAKTEPRSLVASARAKLEAARRSIAERSRADDDLPTKPVAATPGGTAYQRQRGDGDVDQALSAPPTTPREPTPIGQPKPRDDSPAIAALKRFDNLSFAPAKSDTKSDTTSETASDKTARRATIVNAERHLIAPVQRAIGRRPRVRKVTRVVRHVDPWTVFKVAAVFSLVLYGVLLTAGVLLWNVAHTTGTIDNIEQFFETFGWTEFELKGGQIYHSAWIAGLFGALGLTGLAVMGATLFNLITDLVGGIRFTVLEEEVVEKTVSPMRRFTVRRTQSASPDGD